MINENLIYSTIIEHDGRIGKQLTFLGSMLLGSVVILGIVLVVSLAFFL